MTGFTILTDAAYLGVAEVLIEGLLKFTKAPVFVLGVNCQMPARERVYTSMMTLAEPFYHAICQAKFELIKRCPFESFVMLDADMVPNWNVGELLELAQRAWEFPVLLKYPMAEDSNMSRLTASTKLSHSQSGVIVFSRLARSRWPNHSRHLHYWLDAKDSKGEPHLDEPIFNALLARVGANLQLSYCCPRWEAFHTYVTGADTDLLNVYPNAPTTWHLFHGCKDAVEASKMLEDIIEKGALFQASRTLRAAKPFVYCY